MTTHIATNIVSLPVDTNAAGLTEHAAMFEASVGKSVVPTFTRFEKQMVDAWPEFKAAATAAGLTSDSALWSQFQLAAYGVLERHEKSTTGELIGKLRETLVAPNARAASSTLTPTQKKLCAGLGITETQFLAQRGELTATNARTEPSHEKISRLLGLTPAQHAAAYGGIR